MKNLRYLTFLGAIFFVFHSHARLITDRDKGGEGHGGDVVACFRNGMDKVIVQRAKKNRELNNKQDPIGDDGMKALIGNPELLDLYQLRYSSSLDGLSVKLIDNPISYQKGFEDAMKRAKNTNYLFYEFFLNKGARLLPLKNFSLVPYGVVEVDDSNSSVNLKMGCLLLQIAVQRKVGESYFVEIDERLFSRMATLDQTALITHEKIINTTMNEFIILGSTFEADEDTNRGRKLNGNLYMQDFKPDFARTVHERLIPIMRPSMSYFNINCPVENYCGYRMNYIDANGNTSKWHPLNASPFSGIYQNTMGYPGFYDYVEYPAGQQYLGVWFKSLSGLGHMDQRPSEGLIDYNKSTSLPQNFRTALNLKAKFKHREDGHSFIKYFFVESSPQLIVGKISDVDFLEIDGVQATKLRYKITSDFKNIFVQAASGIFDYFNFQVAVTNPQGGATMYTCYQKLDVQFTKTDAGTWFFDTKGCVSNQ